MVSGNEMGWSVLAVWKTEEMPTQLDDFPQFDALHFITFPIPDG